MKKAKTKNTASIWTVLIIIILVVGIIVLNTVTFFSMSSKQTDEIGTHRIIKIRDDLQKVLVEAKSRINMLSYEFDSFMSEGHTHEELRQFVVEKKEESIRENGNIISVFLTNSDWSIIPGYVGEKYYDRSTRMWYQELETSKARTAISSSYQDLFTDNMCVTISKYLGDGNTVIGLDYYLNNIQQSINQMREQGTGDALIVDTKGTIVGYTDESIIGANLSLVLPKYETALRLAESITKDCESFELEIDGKNKTVFCTKTENNWYLIYSVDSHELYGDTYSQLIRNTILYVLFAIGITILYLYNNKNRKRAENALREKEEFFGRVSNEFRAPLSNILHSSEYEIFNSSENQKEVLNSIKESGLHLSAMMDNLFSYSNIVTKTQEEREEIEIDKKQKFFQRALIFTVVIAMVIAVIFSVHETFESAQKGLREEVESYSNVIGNWMTKQESILEMFANVIAANPDILQDYDETITFLDDITKNYDEISVTYITNPKWGNQGVMMNNGWQPEKSYILEERQWYKDTIESENGLNISDPYFDAQTGLYCITFSKTVYSDSGKFIGVFAIDFYLDKLVGILGSTYSDNGYAFLVDGSGVIINHPHHIYELTENLATNIETSEYSKVVKNKNGISLIKDFDGNYKICIQNKENISDFSVITVKNFMYIYGAGIVRIVTLLVILVVCIILIMWIMKALTEWQFVNRKQLEDAVDTAVRANESQAQFFAQMSHEIRTPINAVLGMNEMIMRENHEESISEYAKNIKSAGNTLLQLINNLLEFSKLQNGKLELVEVSYDTGIWIDGLANMVVENAEKKGLEFKLEADRTLPKKLYGDDMKLSQIVINLLSNAVKYTPKGSVTLRIICVERDDENQVMKLRVEVEDTGLGIREEDKENLFKAFKRLDTQKNHGVEGTGLGVTIVNELLNMMGSELQFESEYGEGSKFFFEVTQHIADKGDLGEYVIRKNDNTVSQSQNFVYAPEAEILVVDDNETNLSVARGLLKRSGAKVTLASSGFMALDILREKNFDLIFMDHMMPQMDGMETLKEIKRLKLVTNDTPIIVLTANAIHGAKEMYLAAGFVDYLSKPIPVDQLENILSSYLPKNLISKREDSPVNQKANIKNTVAGATNLSTGELTEENSKEDIPKKNTFITIEGVNVEKGLKFLLDDEEMYMEVLSTFFKDSAAQLETLENSFEAQDWGRYRISAHSIKSNSYTLGADLMGDTAKVSEYAAKDSNVDALTENHPVLVQMYKDLLSHIEKVLEDKKIL